MVFLWHSQMKASKLIATLSVFAGYVNSVSEQILLIIFSSGIPHAPQGLHADLSRVFAVLAYLPTQVKYFWFCFKYHDCSSTQSQRSAASQILSTHRSWARNGRSRRLWLPSDPCTTTCTSGYSTLHRTPATKGKKLQRCSKLCDELMNSDKRTSVKLQKHKIRK